MSNPSVVPVAPRLGPRAWALIVPAGLIVVALLVGILGVLASVRSQIVEQNQRTRLLIQKADPTFRRAPSALDDARPVLRDAVPVLEATRKALPQARRTARDGRRLVAAATPVVADLAPVVAELPGLLGDLAPAAADLRPVARQLRAADLPRLLADVQRLATTGDRALPAVLDLATEVKDRELLRRLSRTLPNIGRITQLQRSAVQSSRQTLTLTTSIEGLLRESLTIQKRILARAESIDRKLPGPTAP